MLFSISNLDKTLENRFFLKYWAMGVEMEKGNAATLEIFFICYDKLDHFNFMFSILNFYVNNDVYN